MFKVDSQKGDKLSVAVAADVLRQALYRHLWKLPEGLRTTVRARAMALDPEFVDAMVQVSGPWVQL